MVGMTSLLTRRERAEMRRLFKSVVVEIVGIPPAMVLAWAVLLGTLDGLACLPATEFASDFIWEVVGPVAVLQAKLLLVAGAIGAFCFIVGGYRIDILASYAADKLNSKVTGLALFWASMLAGVRTLFYLPTTPSLRVPIWACTPGARTGFVSGDTPQSE